MSLSVLAKTAELAWELLKSYDIDPVPIFQQARIDPGSMQDMHTRISQASVTNLWALVAEKVDDPCFGLRAGKLWHPSYMYALGYGWLTSSTLRTALNRLQRYSHLVNTSIRVSLTDTERGLQIDWSNPAIDDAHYWHADGSMALLITMCRANYGSSLDP